MHHSFLSRTIALLYLLIQLPLLSAQEQSPLPMDPKIKKGQLPNGFTYYIRKNTEPQNRVTIYLVNKVGSILETDEEQGLAHFLEHMNFNGTRHFPKNELVSYLQKSGIKFGGDLNAFTSFDQTVYQLPLPTDDAELLKNGFQIMRDWAHDALLEADEIDNERGIILEEKRLRSNAQQRMQQAYFPVLLNNSTYARRIPIGTDEVLKGFKHTTLRNFYSKWYRPDLQALIVVGDIDVNAVEKTIQNLFSDLKAPDNAPARKEYTINLLNTNQYFLGTDKEINMPSIQVFSKFIQTPTKTREDYKHMIERELLNSILNERFSDVSKQKNTGYVFARSGVNTLLANLSAFATTVAARAENLEKAFKTVWTEVERIKRFGITQSELDRARQVYLSKLEASYNEKDKTPSASFVNEYVRNFTDGEAIPGLEYENTMCRELATTISVSSMQAVIEGYIKDTNRDLIVIGPDKDKDLLPSREQLGQWMNDVNNSSITGLKDEISNQPLMTEIPTKGKIVNSRQNKQLGTTTLILSNGSKVVLKPSSFKNDEIRINASAQGGTSLYDDADFESAAHAAECVVAGGAGSFSQSQLQKMLSAKRIAVLPFMSERFQGLNGISTPKNLEATFQLIHLYFTQPRKDFQIYNTELERSKLSLSNRGNDPATVFADSVNALLNNYNIRRAAPSVAKIEKIKPERAYEIYRERFANAANFCFTIVGNFSADSIRPLLETYIASLPGTSGKDRAKDQDIAIPSGRITKNIYKGIDQKSTVKMVYSGKFDYSEKEKLNIDALADLLTIKLLQRLREKESGVYGISATAQVSKYPQPRYSITIGFGCAPSNAEKLIHSAKEVVDSVKQTLPQQADVEKVVNEDLRALELKMKTNGYWMMQLVSKNQMNENPETILQESDNIRAISAKTINKMAKKYLTGENLIQFVLFPGK